MTIAQIRNVVRALPFKPFTICLTDGREFYIPHPECIAIPPEASRTFIVAQGDEDYAIIDLLLVTSIDFRSTKTRRRRRA